MVERIYFRHARQILASNGKPICAAGIRAWCVRNSIDLQTFIHEGIVIERFVEIGDAYAVKVIAIAQAETSHGQS